jgi:hypothetical protein
MNEAHLRICASPEWAAYVEPELLPWALQEAGLGDEVLEVGPGPGLTTDVLPRQPAGNCTRGMTTCPSIRGAWPPSLADQFLLTGPG